MDVDPVCHTHSVPDLFEDSCEHACVLGRLVFQFREYTGGIIWTGHDCHSTCKQIYTVNKDISPINKDTTPVNNDISPVNK